MDSIQIYHFCVRGIPDQLASVASEGKMTALPLARSSFPSTRDARNQQCNVFSQLFMFSANTRSDK
jgi:hypothetical protein